MNKNENLIQITGESFLLTNPNQTFTRNDLMCSNCHHYFNGLCENEIVNSLVSGDYFDVNDKFGCIFHSIFNFNKIKNENNIPIPNEFISNITDKHGNLITDI